ncbi:glycerate kinase [Aeribacillus sp. FSL K6-8394]|uniref:glycerate kinase n=1 Tax=Aeribacillus sp. FSL K6-8394 TaxID=2954570 RepID=UPI0030FAE41B
MKIIVAPDSFKGSLSASQVCWAIKKGIYRVIKDAQVIELPMADGGEGTMENLVCSTKGQKISVKVKDPLGRIIDAEYGVLGDRETVVIETAQASGLTLLKDHERNPLYTSSYGTGQLIKHALNKGYRKFIIGLGGSATNDGGMGMLKALGIKFYDESGQLLNEGGGYLTNLAYYDDSTFDPRIKESSFIIASDVTNPLCGPQGASMVYGPQKGATSEMIKILDKGLSNLAKVIYQQKGIDVRNIPGAGAAGGMGATFIAFFNATLRSGIDIVMEKIQFSQKLQEGDLVITGEGKLDQQTLSGKVIVGVSRLAKKLQIPVIALCGTVKLDGEILDELGITAAFSIVDGPCTLLDAQQYASDLIVARTEQIMRLISRYFYK